MVPRGASKSQQWQGLHGFTEKIPSQLPSAWRDARRFGTDSFSLAYLIQPIPLAAQCRSHLAEHGQVSALPSVTAGALLSFYHARAGNHSRAPHGVENRFSLPDGAKKQVRRAVAVRWSVAILTPIPLPIRPGGAGMPRRRRPLPLIREELGGDQRALGALRGSRLADIGRNTSCGRPSLPSSSAGRSAGSGVRAIGIRVGVASRQPCIVTVCHNEGVRTVASRCDLEIFTPYPVKPRQVRRTLGLAFYRARAGGTSAVPLAPALAGHAQGLARLAVTSAPRTAHHAAVALHRIGALP